MIPTTFEVRNSKLEEKLKQIGQMLREAMPEGWGFMLIIASLGEGGALFYTSSINRQDMINTMREFIAHNEPN